MIGIFLKELRENLKWAAVIFCVACLFVYYDMRRGDPFFLYRLPNGIPFLPPLAGLVFGIVQSIFETKPDNWAFVVHRPVSRRAIYIARSAAALLLLYLSVGLPFALATVWAATPGNLAAPFQSRAILPQVVDTFNAGSFYFAGVVLTLRKARWFGSRLLPAGLALLSTAAIMMFVQEFWQCMLAIFLVQALGALAAWGIFATAGEGDWNGPWRVGLGAMIFTGALMLGVIGSTVVQVFYSSSTMQWQQYRMDKDGNLLHVVWTLQNNSERSSTITDVADNPMKQYEGIDIDDPANAERLVSFGNTLFDDGLNHGYIAMLNGSAYRNAAPGVIRLRSVAPPTSRLRSLCYFNSQNRIINLYDPVTRVLEGTVGPGGFAGAATPPTELFPDTLLNAVRAGNNRVLAFPLVVYWLELHLRNVRPIFTASADDPVFSATELPPQTDPSIMVATRKFLHLLRPSGETIVTIPIPGDPSKCVFQPAILPSSHHLEIFVGSIPNLPNEHPDHRSEYLEYDTDGQLVRRTVMPREQDLNRAKKPEAAAFGAVFPVALAPLIPSFFLDGIFDLRTEEYASLFHGFMIGSGILCGAASLLLGQRCGFPRNKLIAWCLGNLILGPAGVVTMLSLNIFWPREVCSACRVKRRIGQRDCPHCAAALPPPELDGREIFEPLDQIALAG